MLKQIITFIFTCLIGGLSSYLTAQEIPIGAWRDHLPYTDAISLTQGNNVIYCATTSAVFTYDKVDFSVARLNLVNGLSDIGIKKIKFNPNNNRVVIAYVNGNLDIIDENNNIINIPFIKNSNVIGSKTINDIYISGTLAYLSTGFGIVVLDMDRLEIQDTYLIADLGAYVNVNSITIDVTNIYAATEDGVFYAAKNDPSLADYNVWSKIPSLGNLVYSNIVFFSNQLFVIQDRGVLPDSVYYDSLGTWRPFIDFEGYSNNLCVMDENSMAIVWDWGISLYGTDLNKYAEFTNINPREILRDPTNEYWIAENDNGLVKFNNHWAPVQENITLNGPSSPNVFNMEIVDSEIWTVSGGRGTFISTNLINHKKEGIWDDLSGPILNNQGSNSFDFNAIAVNPSNPSNVYAGSWFTGLYEFNNGTVSAIYDARNSVLDSVSVEIGRTTVGSIKFDTDNNLWVSSSYTSNILAVKTPANAWYSYSFPGFTSTSDSYIDMVIDENGYKWLISPESNKILIFDDNRTLDDKTDDRVANNNNFPGAKILTIAEDQDGEIWVGTDEGVGVFYNPSNVFDENIQAEEILIQQNGVTQVLLGSENITSIAIDGANRKWLGTRNSGVYLMSPDGTEEVEHFTTDNSPLFSNTIYDIAIDNTTGEVYFGTEKGLISYKGTATEPDSDFNNVFVYPNPVRPGFDGTIAIRGLVKDTDVRITDISGNIVYKTTSLGGQAVWDGKDFNGNRVKSGVYMVFNGSADGSKKAAAKILFIN